MTYFELITDVGILKCWILQLIFIHKSNVRNIKCQIELQTEPSYRKQWFDHCFQY